VNAERDVETGEGKRASRRRGRSGRRRRLRFWTLPNVLTMIRVALIPGVVVSLLDDSLTGFFIAYALIGIGEITDATDGYIARSRGEVSDLGRLLDPLADSLSRFIVFATLISMGYGRLWMLLVLFLRDMVVAYLRSFAASHGVVMAARSSGKIKAGAQAAAIAAVLLGIIASRSSSAGPPEGAEQVVFWVGFSVTLAAGLVYLAAFRIRGWLRSAILATTFGLAGMILTARFAPPFGAFDARAFGWWPILGAVAVTAYSLVDYVWGFVRVAFPDRGGSDRAGGDPGSG
jgi:CDP-diacylglycerol--glycerol-3-phosphate 3-phosphatidyltransferase